MLQLKKVEKEIKDIQTRVNEKIGMFYFEDTCRAIANSA